MVDFFQKIMSVPGYSALQSISIFYKLQENNKMKWINFEGIISISVLLEGECCTLSGSTQLINVTHIEGHIN